MSDKPVLLVGNGSVFGFMMTQVLGAPHASPPAPHTTYTQTRDASDFSIKKLFCSCVSEFSAVAPPPRRGNRIHRVSDGTFRDGGINETGRWAEALVGHTHRHLQAPSQWTSEEGLVSLLRDTPRT
ncbi:hypothetical protein FQA47_011900 [Oryzias melastigma]|uniref:Uncharacterized protein n=1 Tax=Oryzias melastigma TaxID=30732 RepID=A0A834C5V0_ORYME|nr:hypothetical protein FQA47_011900 [Oryzias melastigma]